MSKQMGKTIALVASAGKGLRMASDIEKPYLKIADKPILAHTLDALDQCPEVDEYVIMVDPGRQADCRTQVTERYGYERVRDVIAGGGTRQESVYNGLRSLPTDTAYVVVHDAARPCVTPQVVSDSIRRCETVSAVLVAVPVKDTVKTVDNGVVTGTPDRSRLWLAQTPQTFAFGLLLDAHLRAIREGYEGTDDASLVERAGHPVHVLAGEYTNLKITTPDDLDAATQILAGRSFPRAQDLEQRKDQT